MLDKAVEGWGSAMVQMLLYSESVGRLTWLDWWQDSLCCTTGQQLAPFNLPLVRFDPLAPCHVN